MIDNKRRATSERTKRTWLNGYILYERVGAVSVVEVARKWRVYARVGGRTEAQALGFEYYKSDCHDGFVISSLRFMGLRLYERTGKRVQLLGFLNFRVKK